MAEIKYPEFARDRGIGYWLRPANLIVSRRKYLRTDHSIEWRKSHTTTLAARDLAYYNVDARYSVPFSALLNPDVRSPDKFTFAILGDTGEGDQSQYALVPLLRALAPDFILIAGDIAYPAGRIGADRNTDDYIAGMFEPYKNLRIPIWGVPGNHEYYCKDKGRDFFEIFCGTHYENRWQHAGLSFIRQPGAFWELREPGHEINLAVIGIDTGLHGNLDGHHSWWQFWRRREKADEEQLGWLHERLESAERAQCKVILLFHIPTLGNQCHQSEAHMQKLQRMITAFSCVRLVVVGHIHNYQQYPPDVFAHYLQEKHAAQISAFDPPHYMVCGGGGAYLTSTDFSKRQYQCTPYPSAATWREHATKWRQLVEKTPWSRSLIGKAVARIEKGVLYDADQPAYLSFLLVKVDRNNGNPKIEVQPVFLGHVKDLFAHLPDEETVMIHDEHLPFSPQAVDDCLQPAITL